MASKKSAEDLIEDIRRRVELEERLKKSIDAYNDQLRDLYDLQKSILLIKEKENSLVDEINRDEKERISLLKKAKGSIKTLTVDEQNRYNLLVKNIKQNKLLTNEIKEQLEIYEQIAEETKEVMNNISKSRMFMKQLSKDSKIVTSSLSKGFSFLSGGVIDVSLNGLLSLFDPRSMLSMLKATKQTAFQMGLTGKNAQTLEKSIRSAAPYASQLGVSIEHLSKLQGAYSKSLGRNVILTKEGNQAMAGLATAAGMTDESAVEFANNMDLFNVSLVDSAKVFEGFINEATEGGLNAEASVENLQKSLKVAQSYQFKDGIKGVERMAMFATKMKIDMEAMSQSADKAFNPEGAIDMAAQMQVMGGEFAKMADPMQLMFKARNDMEGFTKDMAKASSEFVEVNEKGEMSIAAYQKDRLRNIAQATGLSMEQLQTMAYQQKKIQMIAKETSITNPKDLETIETLAQFSQEKGGFTLNVGGTEKLVKDITQSDMQRIKNERKSLEERKKASQTFDDKFSNLIMQLKQEFLPIMDQLDKTLVPIIHDLQKSLSDGTLKSTIEGFVKSISGIMSWISENPISTLVGGLVGFGLFEAGKWFLNGQILASGFNSVASVGGGMGSSDGLGGGFGNSKLGRRLGKSKIGGKFLNSKMGKGLSKVGSKLRGGGLIGLGTGILGGMALDYANERSDTGSASAYGTNMGSSALSYGSTGAMIGSFLGPVGTAVGAGIGAITGAFVGYFEEKEKEEKLLNDIRKKNDNALKYGSSVNTNGLTYSKSSLNDFIVNDGQVHKIHNRDTLAGYKPGGPIDREVKQNGTSSTITLSPLTINGTIKLDGGTNGSTMIDISKNPMLVRELTRLIAQEVKKSVSGGKLNSNTSTS